MAQSLASRGLQSLGSEGDVHVFSSPDSLPPNTTPFADYDVVLEIAEVNPYAATTLLRFHPSFYFGMPFVSGTAGSQNIITFETVRTEINFPGRGDLVKGTIKPLPDGHYISMHWELVKPNSTENGYWVFSAHERQPDGSIVSTPYPNIEVKVSASKPYTMIGWRSQ